MATKVIEIADLGTDVFCDYCNLQYTPASPQMGGILVGSYAVCPVCLPRTLEALERSGELNEISGRCPEGMTYHAWVMQLRGGDNTVRVISFDDADEVQGLCRPKK